MKDLARARATARSDLVPLQVISGVRSHEVRTVQLPPSPIRTLRTVELTPEEEPLLQRFFEQNPEYFVAAYGEPACPKEAHEAIQVNCLRGGASPRSGLSATWMKPVRLSQWRMSSRIFSRRMCGTFACSLSS